MDQEVRKMLQKGAIKGAQSSTNQVLSSVFVMPKKDSGHRPVINLKKLNCRLPYVFYQNGRVIPLKRRLHAQDRSKRCIFYCH